MNLMVAFNKDLFSSKFKDPLPKKSIWLMWESLCFRIWLSLDNDMFDKSYYCYQGQIKVKLWFCWSDKLISLDFHHQCNINLELK